MLVPGILPGFRRWRPIAPVILAVVAIAATVGAWAVAMPAPVSTDGVAAPSIPAAAIRSVAYIEPDSRARLDTLLVRDAGLQGEPRELARFPYTFAGLHARGSASPGGNLVAVLWVDGSRGAGANLSLVSLDGAVRTVEGAFEYLSPIAWASDGSRLAAVAGGGPGELVVQEVDVAPGAVTEAARFTNVFQAVPIGYSLDGSRLFIVVVDQSGSNLWVRRGGTLERVAELSPGRTRDWALSPDGSRVAFIDILSASSRNYVGKTLTIATGSVTALPAGRNQVGAAWQPGNPLPVFGGPGGSLQLADPSPDAAWVIPLAYAPLGDYVAVSVVGATSDPTARPPVSIELATPASRVRLTDTPGASFVGWVQEAR